MSEESPASDYFAAAATPGHPPPQLLTTAPSQHHHSPAALRRQTIDLEMCVDEIDESEDENNEVFVEVDDDSDTD